MRGGFAGPELDIAAVLAASVAQHVPADVAVAWAADFAAGMHAGRDALKAEEKPPS